MENKNINQEPQPEIQEEQQPFFLKKYSLAATFLVAFVYLVPLVADATPPMICIPELVPVSIQVVKVSIFFVSLLMQVLVLFWVIRGKKKKLAVFLQLLVIVLLTLLFLTASTFCSIYYPLVASLLFLVLPSVLFVEIFLTFIILLLITVDKGRKARILVTVSGIVAILIGSSVYFSFPQIPGLRSYQQNQTYFEDRKIESEKETVDWNAKEISLSNKEVTVTDLPPMQVSEGSVFGERIGESGEFVQVEISPDGIKVAFSVTNGVHEFGWVFNHETEEFIPLVFSYGGGAEILRWENNYTLVTKVTTPKPDTYIETIDLNNLPEYPRVAN